MGIGTTLDGGGFEVTPASAAACLHHGKRPVALSSQEILFHMMSSQLLPTMPPVSREFWFQHLWLGWVGWGGGSLVGG